MTARVCERDGCEVEVTGRSTRCPKHQREHRREAESARKRQARNADKCGQAASAFAAVTPDDADREAAAREALKRAGDFPADFIERTKADPGVPIEKEYATAFAKMRRESPADWARVKPLLKKMGVDIGLLQRVMGANDTNGDGKQGRPVEFEDPEPWPEAVDGAALLSDIASFIQRYVSIDPALADTVALWIAVTWIHDRLEISPFLNVTSATPRCGKTILVNEVIGALVRRPHEIGSKVSSAYLFRLIEMYEPTLLLDEIDTYLRDDPELRGDLNSSQRKSGAHAGRLVPLRDGSHEPRHFSTWCPKVFSGIGGMPNTVLDRSIVITLKRRPPDVSLEGWRDRDKGSVETMRRQLARWCEDEAPRIVAGLSGVTFPPGLHDRGRDAWEALLAIGDTAGSDWADRGWAWQACEHVTASTADEETGARERLLGDLRTIYEADGWPEAIASKAALDKLTALEGRPWSEWKRGEKPLSSRELSRLLKPFGVQSRNHLFPDGKQLKAYFLADLEAHWKAYFPEAGDSYPSIRPPAVKQGISCDPYPSTGDHGWTDTDRTKPPETREVDGWTDTNRGSRREDATEPPALPSQPPGTPTAGGAYRRAHDGG